MVVYGNGRVGVSFNLLPANYRPIRNLTQLYIDAVGKSSDNAANEFMFLEDSLRSLLNQNLNFATRLKQQKDAMRNNIFVKLFKGRVRSVDGIRDSLSSFDIEFRSEVFFVAALQIEQFNNSLLSDANSPNDDEMGLYLFYHKKCF